MMKQLRRTSSNLTPECLARGYLEIVAEFQIIGEAECVSCSYVSKSLEEVHLQYLSKVGGTMLIN